MSGATITLSRTTRARLKRLARGPWRDVSTPRPDGLFDVPVSDAVSEAIAARRLAGESDEDAVLRLLRARAEAAP